VSVDEAIAALRTGGVIVLPTDTVYGLAAEAETPAGRDALYRLKGRSGRQPSALLAASVDVLLERLPELPGAVLAALLPGPYTLVVPNPAGRYPWLCGDDPAKIGVRVPKLPAAAARVVGALGAVVATSANLPGEPDPRTVAAVPEELRAGVTAVLDVGELPGVPSTVLDLTGAKPLILRQGAGNPEAALAALDNR
jgi:L-threonylcarbamoyladenylate synthase